MLLSILVPSKNNPIYLESLANGFIKLEKFLTGDAELVLVDNSSTENFELKNLNHKNIIYDWNPSALDMLGNFNRAVGIAKGKYICILGDDDFVLPTIFDVARLLNQNSIDCAMAELSPYYWPKVNTFWVGDNINGILEVPMNNHSHRRYDVKAGLKKVLASGGTQYLNILPSAYHGMVKTSILKNFIEVYGTAFPGPSPDISNAVLLSLHNVSCFKVVPFVISGAAFGSAAAEGASHAHHGDLDERAGFIKRGNVVWPSSVPQFFCGPTMWAVSVINTLQFTNNLDLIPKINTSSMHAACLAYHPQYLSKILSSFFKQKNRSYFKFICGFVTVIAGRLIQFISNFIKYNRYVNFLSSWKIVSNVPDTIHVGKYFGK